MFTENTTIPALKTALKERKDINFQGLIIHSDGGGQYYSKDFLALTTPKIINSMSEMCMKMLLQIVLMKPSKMPILKYTIRKTLKSKKES